MSATCYKIRRKSDGKFSTGTGWPDWSRNGKAWGSLQAIRSHLTLVRGPGYHNPYCSNHEIVPFVLTPCDPVPIEGF